MFGAFFILYKISLVICFEVCGGVGFLNSE